MTGVFKCGLPLSESNTKTSSSARLNIGLIKVLQPDLRIQRYIVCPKSGKLFTELCFSELL